ncbi:regulator of deoxyribodipyrimidine photo-lyase PHR1 [Fusarium circinatum]|uniref:[histone H3]-trimethyl-L-lysine(9) demethylase n=1 Tax=Fusarium circinatum TaxID=48490 RepID=A0A8H6CTJ7_FUSCI|nr:regulator of deoxyribodipyrimidine photo-lyase PHR1 [Fusarium circinatum]
MSESTSTSIDAGIAVAATPNSQDTVVATAPVDTNTKNPTTAQPGATFLHSPPDSNNTAKSDGSDSELSDLEDEPILSDPPQPVTSSDNVNSDDKKEDADEDVDIGEVLPDSWSGAVPIFKPTMHQFKDFKRFMEAVDSYGMKSGIIKVIPPQEWKDALPKLDDLVKQVKVREPIKQDIMGSNGTYRQVNILHGRSYNLPQWRQLCDQSEHQPPARRGERRANAEKPKARTRAATAAVAKPSDPSTPKKRGRGRPAKRGGRWKRLKQEQADDNEDRPMTPVSPKPEVAETEEKPVESVEKDPGEEVEEDYEPTVGRMSGLRQARTKTQTVSARRKYSRREGSAMIDEAAFKDWDYKMDISEYTPERCEELERAYWKTLTYAPPLYGADLMGTLFDESTEQWNLNKLPNLLDVLGEKVPGVNTAYLYLGMWKATFAWHLEDVDLYSINYLHFGAPKQWYSISQADARRFEAAMKNIWPTDAKACDQFLRHKGFLISPQHLKSHYNITVNKCVSYPGEFVVTYPYGYHSGYNLGYNCAEAVNFALDSWLDIGKIAKKCQCAEAQDSVWINVYDIERKLRGEETEYEETEDEEEDDEDEQGGMPTPPSGSGVKFRLAGRKRKRVPGEKGGKVKKIRLRLKSKAEPPCCLCPNDTPSADLLPTDDGRKAHRLCAHYLPETYTETIDGQETVVNVSRIHKGRFELKCLYCRSKQGACFQCSQKRCARAYHATCAAAAGVFVEEEEIPVFSEDGTEYKEQAFEFSCRYHRTKRDKKLDGNVLETDSRVRTAASNLQPGETCQLQYFKGDIFAGVVVENRHDEQTLLIDILPNGDRLEVEWKWLLVPDPADYRLPKASAKAIPMPASQKAKEKLKTKRLHDSNPQKDDPFVEGYTWAEFNSHPVANKEQVKIDFCKPDQIWYYLPKKSTEARAQFTEDPRIPRHNHRGNFLSTVPKPVKPPRPVPGYPPRQAYQPAVPYPAARLDKPYMYKPRTPAPNNYPAMGNFTTQRFTPAAPSPVPVQQQPGNYRYPYARPIPAGQQATPAYSAQRFEVRQSPAYTAPGNTPGVQSPVNTLPHYQQNQWQGRYTPALPAPTPSHPQVAHPYPQPHQVSAPVNHHQASQADVSIFQKYPFFQVNHNRDSTKYRTPYSPWGGFTNGYEGNFRAHIMANKDAYLKGTIKDNRFQSNQNFGAYQPLHHHAPGHGYRASPGSQPRISQQPNLKQVPTPSPGTGTPSFSQFPRPAIKQQYLPPMPMQTHAPTQAQVQAPIQAPIQPQVQPQAQPQKSTPKPQQRPPQKPPQYAEEKPQQRPPQTTQSPNQSSKPKIGTIFKEYKIPPKESPVPLPANFLASMAPTSKIPALVATGKPILQQAESKVSPSTPKVAKSIRAPQQTLSNGQPMNSQKLGTKVSKTPVPIPRLPGVAQISAQGSASASAPTQQHGASPLQDSKMTSTDSDVVHATDTTAPATGTSSGQQDFADVPGGESMEFMDRLMASIRTIARRDGAV